jgi:hypothetical protein
VAWDERRLEANLGTFMRQYGRRAHAGHDPNDRGYDRKVERMVKRMPPQQLDRLLNGDGEAPADAPAI